MSLNSHIEWTDATWNPVRGCRKISPGCKHCYAEVFAERFRGVPGHPYEHGFDLRLVPQKVIEPFLWPAPQIVFVNSMSDLFQADIPEGYVVTVARAMEKANWHIFQVLTKRVDRMADLLRGPLSFAARLGHIWWGVSVEDRKYGLPRIDVLRSSPAQVRFLSIEPLLEDLGTIDLSGIHWVIVGGESGAGARPMREAWVQSILRQCEAAGVPFFFKQWGGRQKSKAGRTLNGRTYDARPQIMKVAIRDRAQRLALVEAFTPEILRWEKWPTSIRPPAVRFGRRSGKDNFVARESILVPQTATAFNKASTSP